MGNTLGKPSATTANEPKSKTSHKAASGTLSNATQKPKIPDENSEAAQPEIMVKEEVKPANYCIAAQEPKTPDENHEAVQADVMVKNEVRPADGSIAAQEPETPEENREAAQLEVMEKKEVKPANDYITAREPKTPNENREAAQPEVMVKNEVRPAADGSIAAQKPKTPDENREAAQPEVMVKNVVKPADDSVAAQEPKIPGENHNTADDSTAAQEPADDSTDEIFIAFGKRTAFAELGFRPPVAEGEILIGVFKRLDISAEDRKVAQPVKTRRKSENNSPLREQIMHRRLSQIFPLKESESAKAAEEQCEDVGQEFVSPLKAAIENEIAMRKARLSMSPMTSKSTYVTPQWRNPETTNVADESCEDVEHESDIASLFKLQKEIKEHLLRLSTPTSSKSTYVPHERQNPEEKLEVVEREPDFKTTLRGALEKEFAKRRLEPSTSPTSSKPTYVPHERRNPEEKLEAVEREPDFKTTLRGALEKEFAKRRLQPSTPPTSSKSTYVPHERRNPETTDLDVEKPEAVEREHDKRTALVAALEKGFAKRSTTSQTKSTYVPSECRNPKTTNVVVEKPEAVEREHEKRTALVAALEKGFAKRSSTSQTKSTYECRNPKTTNVAVEKPEAVELKLDNKTTALEKEMANRRARLSSSPASFESTHVTNYVTPQRRIASPRIAALVRRIERDAVPGTDD